MRQDVNKQMVRDAMMKINEVLKGMRITGPEAMLACQEIVGRMIVDMCATPVAGEELAKFAKDHLERTIRIGFDAKKQAGEAPRIITRH